MAEFKVGGYAVCVKDHLTKISNSYSIKSGEVKEIRSMFTNPIGKKQLLLRFKGMTLPIEEATGLEYGYEASYFLPLDDFKEVTFTKINEEVPVSAQ